jgi:parallel beta-helix repeat protein
MRLGGAAQRRGSKVTTSTALKGFAMVMAFAVVMGLLAASGGDSQAATSCTGKHLYPGANLVSVAAGAPAGTTFCIHQGTYSVSQAVIVQDGDRFIGVYQSLPRPIVKTTSARMVFNAAGSNRALIQDLRIEGAVGDQSCQPSCGRGISGGYNLTVANVWLTLNKNQAIGGAGGGLLVKNSEIDHNGSAPFAQQTGRETAAGIKSVNPMTVQNSYIHDNYWAGVWCDENCGTLRVENNTIVGNGQRGVHTEISIGPQVISGNTIEGNGHFESWSLEAGVLISSVRDVEVYNNTFGGNLDHGVQVVDDGRWPVTGDVSVYGNAMNGDLLNGCLILAVSCPGNY